jgi:hypothetical protein
VVDRSAALRVLVNLEHGGAQNGEDRTGSENIENANGAKRRAPAEQPLDIHSRHQI